MHPLICDLLPALGGRSRRAGVGGEREKGPSMIGWCKSRCLDGHCLGGFADEGKRVRGPWGRVLSPPAFSPANTFSTLHGEFKPPNRGSN